MNIVITMGGLGERFRKAGYTVPKYEIEARGKSLFEWSMLSLKDFWQERFIFLVRAEDRAKSFIEEQCKKLGVENIYIVELDHLTKGQAETAMYAHEYWDAEASMLIYNIDTYVEPGHLKMSDMTGDGAIPCFYAEGTHWSFVRLDESGHVVEVREKERISDHCSLGAYYFRSCNLYADLYRRFYVEGSPEISEQYIAPMYNVLLADGGDVRLIEIAREAVHVLGTPAELKMFDVY
jgi:hypothetical protein